MSSSPEGDLSSTRMDDNLESGELAETDLHQSSISSSSASAALQFDGPDGTQEAQSAAASGKTPTAEEIGQSTRDADYDKIFTDLWDAAMAAGSNNLPPWNRLYHALRNFEREDFNDATYLRWTHEVNLVHIVNARLFRMNSPFDPIGSIPFHRLSARVEHEAYWLKQWQLARGGELNNASSLSEPIVPEPDSPATDTRRQGDRTISQGLLPNQFSPLGRAGLEGAARVAAESQREPIISMNSLRPPPSRNSRHSTSRWWTGKSISNPWYSGGRITVSCGQNGG
jgi:hypothetical protein